jgi:hypothetical protein
MRQHSISGTVHIIDDVAIVDMQYRPMRRESAPTAGGSNRWLNNAVWMPSLDSTSIISEQHVENSGGDR